MATERMNQRQRRASPRGTLCAECTELREDLLNTPPAWSLTVEALCLLRRDSGKARRGLPSITNANSD